MDISIPDELKIEVLKYGAPEIQVSEGYLLDQIQSYDLEFSLAALLSILLEQKEELERYVGSKEWEAYEFLETNPQFVINFNEMRKDYGNVYIPPNELSSMEMEVAWDRFGEIFTDMDSNGYTSYYEGEIGDYHGHFSIAPEINLDLVRRIQFLHLPVLERINSYFSSYQNISWK